MKSLISQIDPITLKAPLGWVNKIGRYYSQFIDKIWTEPEAVKIAIKRQQILFKYWAINNVETLEDAKASIPLCPICGKHLCIPSSVEPVKPGRTWIAGSCHNKDCKNKFVYQRTAMSVKEKYGVDNISSVNDIKELKSKIQLHNHEVRGKEIIDKRKNTVKERYGVLNVSQLNEVKDSKCETFKEHYGVDNIFKRGDIMKEHWMETLGVSNPSKLKVESWANVTLNRIIKSKGTEKEVNGKTFSFLSTSEYEVTSYLSDYINVDNISVNEKCFERVINGEYKYTVVDIALDNTVFIEMKRHNEPFTLEDCKRYESIVVPNLKDNQIYVIYLRNKERRHFMILDKNGTKHVVTTCNFIDSAEKKFGHIDECKTSIADTDKSLAILSIKLLSSEVLTEKGKAVKERIDLMRKEKSLKQ